MAGAFLSGVEGEESAASGMGVEGGFDETVREKTPEKRKTGGGGQGMAGDFNPKDLASAMRTLLSKDQG